MIEYNYNFACIATAEEMATVYDEDAGQYKIFNDPELQNRFFEIPQILDKGIIPYVLIKTGIENDFYTAVLFPTNAHAYENAGRMESGVTFTGGWMFDEGVLIAD